jgi:putative component of membrane protein insertase Oxa1/YidC/SpoIIIJ protein YidD
MKLLIILIFFLSSSAFSQYEKVIWEKADISYRNDIQLKKREYSYESRDTFNLVLKTAINAYRVLVSDLDGDNCPFHPSCSAFFLEAVNETDFIQGILMFFDRFTRDASFIGRSNRYPKHKSGKLYDPVYSYKLSKSQYLPPHLIIDVE